MKKLLTRFLLVLTFFTLSLSLNLNHAQASNAPTETTKTVSFSDMIVFTAMQAGENYTGYELVNFGAKHGNVANGSINNFTTYHKDSGWSGSVGTETDNVYSEGSYKIHTLANEGFIFEMTAKYPVRVNIARSQLGGWVDPAKVNVYKNTAAGLKTIKSLELAATTTLEEYSIGAELAKGETLYWEFIFPWSGDHRNMENLPTATFTYDESIKPETVIESVSFPDMVIFTAKQNGENCTGNKLVDFGVKHGNVANESINKFTTYTFDEANWKGARGTEGDNAYTKENWQLHTQANDGFIFEFVAKEPVKVKISKTTIGEDWVDNTNLNTYIKRDDKVDLIKTVALSNSTPAEDYGVEIELAAGDTLYYEFIFEWTAHRNMMNLPSAVFEYVHESTHQFENWNEQIDPTCTEAGVKGYYTCSHCEIKFDKDYKPLYLLEIPSLGHNEVDDAAVAATCTETGLTAGKHCSVCNTVTVAQEEVAALGHTWKDADCETPKTCTVCKDTEGEATGHNYIEGICEYCESVDPEHYFVVTIEEALEKEDGAKVSVSGTVSSINTVWSDSYNNISVTITDSEGNSLYIYRMNTKVVLGDIITVKGVMGTYNGRQIAQGSTAEITGHDSSYDYVEMTILEAVKASDNTNIIVTGTVVEIATAYNEDYKNISVYISDDEGNRLYLYRLSGNVEVGQIIKVKGAMATYKEARQLTGGTFEVVGTHECKNYFPATCTEAAKCILCGKENGESLGHTEVEDAAVPATCKNTGLTAGKHCSVCDTVTVEQKEVAKVDHVDSDKNNVCDICGQEQNQPAPQKPEVGCKGSAVASMLGIITLAGAVVVLRKKREE